MTNIYNSIIQFTSMIIGLLLFLIVMPFMGVCILLIWGTGNGVVFERKKNKKSDKELLFFRIENIYLKEKFQYFHWLALPQIFQLLTGELILFPTLQKVPQFRQHLPGPDNWLRTVSLLIPHQYREPMFGDLLEDREQMRASGKHFLWIEFATCFQLLIALANRPKLWVSGLVGWVTRSFFMT